MHSHDIMRRYEAINNAGVKGRVKALKGSKAWLHVQQVLRRSGRTCAPMNNVLNPIVLSHTDSGSLFFVHQVKYLCGLYALMQALKEMAGISTEMQLFIPKYKFPAGAMIVPETIRRKAEGFRQYRLANMSERECVLNENPPTGFQGSLYQALLHSCGSKENLDKCLATLVDNKKQLIPEDKPFFLDAAVPTLSFLWYELRRLYHRDEAESVMDIYRKHTSKAAMLENFANAIYFTFIYSEDGNELYNDYFSGLYGKKARENAQEKGEVCDYDYFSITSVRLIMMFTEEVYRRYLSPSQKRHVQKKQSELRLSGPHSF